jgi:hydroxyacylglutathione hydrolase
MANGKITTIELKFVNAFLIEVADGFILVDTGAGIHWSALEKELLTAGCLPDKLKLVIITHGDFDHTGNCAKLQKTYHSRIAMHEGDRAMAERGERIERRMRTMRTKFLFLFRRLLNRPQDFDTFKPDMTLTEGQQLTAYGWDATVFHFPGHTRGSIGILTLDGSFFSGDTLTNSRKPDYAVLVENGAELQRSLSRLKTLPISTVYPGHGKPFDFRQIAATL